MLSIQIFGYPWMKLKRCEKKDYQVNRELMNHTKNSEVFMYCLSAYYSFETFIEKKIGKKFHGSPFEVTDEIFKSSHSLVFKEAANCMHTIKAVL